MKRSSLTAVLFSSFALATAPASAAVVYTQGWDSGTLENWTATGERSSVSLQPGGGDPAAYLYAAGSDLHDTYDIGARLQDPAIAGNYADRNINLAQVDLLFLEGPFDAAWLRFSDGGNGWMYPVTSAFPLGMWQSYETYFDPTWTDAQARAAGWLTFRDLDPTAVPSNSFADVMDSVYLVEVRISGDGILTAGIDNYTLVSIPEPASVVLFVLGFLAVLRMTRRVQLYHG